MISPASTNPALTAAGPQERLPRLHDRLRPGSGWRRRTPSRALGKKTVFVVDDSTPYGEGLAAEFADTVHRPRRQGARHREDVRQGHGLQGPRHQDRRPRTRSSSTTAASTTPARCSPSSSRRAASRHRSWAATVSTTRVHQARRRRERRGRLLHLRRPADRQAARGPGLQGRVSRRSTPVRRSLRTTPTPMTPTNVIIKADRRGRQGRSAPTRSPTPRAATPSSPRRRDERPRASPVRSRSTPRATPPTRPSRCTSFPAASGSPRPRQVPQ